MGAVLLWLLKALLWLALALLVLILLILVAVLFVPVSFAGRLESAIRPEEEAPTGYTGEARWQARLRWGLMLVRFAVAGQNGQVSGLRLSVLGIPIRLGRRHKAASDGDDDDTAKKAGGTKPATRRKRKAKRKRSFRWDELRLYIREGAQLLVRLWAALHLQVHGALTFGFDDPADTGMMLGLLWAASVPRRVQIQPDFLGPRLEGWLDLSGRIWGYQVAAALWSAFWHLPVGPAGWLRVKRWFIRTSNLIAGGNPS